MIRDCILTAVVAGIVAALLLTAVQSAWITPLILQAETYEDAAEANSHSVTETPAPHEHSHHDSEWKPQNGWQRTALTLAANLLMGIGYGLVLVASFILWRAPRSAAWGIAYGVAGFCVFFAAPGLGLPPELPGTAAADLAARQQWWLMSAAATAAGLIVFFSRKEVWLRGAAVLLIIAPHLVPAPHLAVETSLAPESLQTHFKIATTFGNALFWLSLGFTAAAAFRRLRLANEVAAFQ